MSDVFAVGLRTFSEDTDNDFLREVMLSLNSSIATANEIGGGGTGLLPLLTVIGTSLSIVGVVLAFITYSLLSDLRTLSGTSLLNLLAALFLAHLVLVVGAERTSDRDLCLAIGFLLQYMWFSVPCWVTIMFCDMYLTFRDNINLQPSSVSENHKSLFKCTVFAWGVPGVSIGFAALIHFHTPWDKDPLVSPTCWILGKASFLFTFVLPFVCLLVANCWFFVKSVILVRYAANLQITVKLRNKMKKRRHLQLLLYGKITIVLVGTWLCCLIAQFTMSMIFWVAFTILICLQGFTVSIAYCCNPRVFRLYSKSILNNTYGSAELSGSTSMALLNWELTPDVV